MISYITELHAAELNEAGFMILDFMQSDYLMSEHSPLLNEPNGVDYLIPFIYEETNYVLLHFE